MFDSLKLSDPAYPLLLKEIYSPPGILYYKGNPECLKKCAIAVVGTRKFSDYGKYAAEKIIEELSVYDITIVSGLARGIDTIAHKTALKFDLPTIAILGSGLNNIYPPENRGLAAEIVKNGLLLSQFEPDTEPFKLNFPQRNRIISGLSQAVLVIEAPEKSGALITARKALEQNRDIFAVPGDIDRKNSAGITQLFQRGAAYPVSSGKEIIENIRIGSTLPFKKRRSRERKEKKRAKILEPQFKLTEKEKMVFDLIPRFRSISVDELCLKITGKFPQKNKLSAREILITLSTLEIKSLITPINGKYKKIC